MSSIPQCYTCLHYRPPSDGREEHCAAFPRIIPGAVILNQIDHRLPIAGDEGIRWTPETVGARHPMGPEPVVVKVDPTRRPLLWP